MNQLEGKKGISTYSCWASRAFTAFCIALCFSLTLTFFGPLKIYLGNVAEFSFEISYFIPMLLKMFLYLFIPIFLLLLALGEKFKGRGIAIVGMLAILLWLQGNIMVWDYGLLDGRYIDWNEKWYLGILDISIWVGLICLAFFKSHKISKQMRFLSILLILVQLGLLIIEYHKAPNITRIYKIDHTNKFVFSKTKNAILLVVDAFESPVFQKLMNDHPGFEKSFQGFTYFPNTLGGFNNTYQALPLLFTGKYYNNTQTLPDYYRNAFLSDSSLPKNLKDNGFYVQLFPIAPRYIHMSPLIASNIKMARNKKYFYGTDMEIFDFTLFRCVPHYLKSTIIFGDAGLLEEKIPGFTCTAQKSQKTNFKNFKKRSLKNIRDLRFINEMLNSTQGSAPLPTFKYYHMFGLHPPFIMDENHEYTTMKNTLESTLRVATGILKYLELFLSRLKQEGLYDNSLIVICGDHGLKVPGINVVELGGQKVDVAIQRGRAFPLLLIKPIGAKGELKLSMAPVSMQDIPKTILSELGLSSSGLPGESAFSIPNDAERKRKYYNFSFKPEGDGFLPPLIEFVVKDFCWLPSSWNKPNRILEPRMTNMEYFSQLMYDGIKGRKFFGTPIFYGRANNTPMLRKTREGFILIEFWKHNPKRGDYVGVKFPIQIKNSKGNTLTLEIYDGFNKNKPGICKQYILINGKEIYSNDIGVGDSTGWHQVSYLFPEVSVPTELKIEMKFQGDPSNQWEKTNWADTFISGICIRNLSIK
jgi:hypothetical protein